MALYGRSYTYPIIRKGDPNSAPISAGGVVPLAVVANGPGPRPTTPAPTIRKGDPNSAPIPPVVIPTTLVVTSQPQPARGSAMLGSASADVYYGSVTLVSPVSAPAVASVPIVRAAPSVATTVASSATPQPVVQIPQAPRASVPAPIIEVAPAVASTVVPGGPAPLIVLPQPSTAKAPVVLWRQLQDGYVAPAGGPVPFSLVVAPQPKRRQPWVWLSRSSVPQVPPPHVCTPGLTVLDAHSSLVTLAAHSSGLGLGAHVSSVVLNAHTSLLTLNPHTSLTVLAAHTSLLALDAHANGLTLDC